jgi:hypothetical protein
LLRGLCGAITRVPITKGPLEEAVRTGIRLLVLKGTLVEYGTPVAACVRGVDRPIDGEIDGVISLGVYIEMMEARAWARATCLAMTIASRDQIASSGSR